MSESRVLTDLLSAEHAAVYAYGVLGARLDKPTRELALAADDAHRSHRNRLTQVLRSRQLPAPGPAAAYDVSVATRPQALLLAVRVEDDLAVRWRDLLALSDDAALRASAVLALQDSAVRAARWRRLAGITPATQAFPGEAAPPVEPGPTP